MSSGAIRVSAVDRSSVSVQELEALLHRVYVEGGFTDPHVAEAAFAGDAVLARGELLITRDESTGALTGMVIVVDPGSRARRIASDDEVEMHLLAVAPDHRKTGVGRALVEAAIARGRAKSFGKVVLWTQPAMKDAHRLYERSGFVRAAARDFGSGERTYWVFEKLLI